MWFKLGDVYNVYSILLPKFDTMALIQVSVGRQVSGSKMMITLDNFGAITGMPFMIGR